MRVWRRELVGRFFLRSAEDVVWVSYRGFLFWKGRREVRWIWLAIATYERDERLRPSMTQSMPRANLP